jgi:hypothetical protein
MEGKSRRATLFCIYNWQDMQMRDKWSIAKKLIIAQLNKTTFVTLRYQQLDVFVHMKVI